MLGPELPYRLGPYELHAIIGAGGMGEVYRARDTRLDRTVAIKIVKREFSDRFEREARAISALNHPHICTLYDVGTEGDTSYLVMEHIEGRHLACPIGVPEALDLGVQIADALSAAHRQGIVHRDLKPGNILITRVRVTLLDFGLARVQSQVAALDQGTTPEPCTAAYRARCQPPSGLPCLPPSEHLVQNETERMDVSSRVHSTMQLPITR